MEPTAPDLRLVSKVTKGVPVTAPDSGCSRVAVTALVAISIVILTLGVLWGMEEGLGGPWEQRTCKRTP